MFWTVALVSLLSFGLNLPHMATRLDGFVHKWKFTTARGMINVQEATNRFSINTTFFAEVDNTGLFFTGGQWE